MTREDLSLTPDEVLRFKQKLILTDSGCLEYRGETNSKGYGRFVIYRDGRRIRLLAHRLSLSLIVPVEDDLIVRHSCDNPPCANPRHLLVGTQADNMRDAIERGRINMTGLAEGRKRREAIAQLKVASGKKTCPQCGREKPFEHFYRNRARFDGVQSECKDCQSRRPRSAA